MFLDQFHDSAEGAIRISARQASRFAKEVAGDYNPIHDEDAKRFCVPGDLLFALVLAYQGVSERMQFIFQGMVGADVPLSIVARDDTVLDVVDHAGKTYLRVERSGCINREPDFIEAFVRRYVAFSGKNFPHYMKPLMAEKKVMFNPDRPLVIYDSMGFELDMLDARELDMELASASMDVAGTRGESRLHFRITAGGQSVGSGSKKLVISGLREYDEQLLQEFIAEFTRRKQAYEAAL
ncbi:MAG: DUF3581 domain-containing protein [Ectothiorhodospiraceae bacterium]|nr:DUF3581 domain-containing protein [Ectothiorhodospiraceae bacterium]